MNVASPQLEVASSNRCMGGDTRSNGPGTSHSSATYPPHSRQGWTTSVCFTAEGNVSSRWAMPVPEFSGAGNSGGAAGMSHLDCKDSRVSTHLRWMLKLDSSWALVAPAGRSLACLWLQRPHRPHGPFDSSYLTIPSGTRGSSAVEQDSVGSLTTESPHTQDPTSSAARIQSNVSLALPGQLAWSILPPWTLLASCLRLQGAGRGAPSRTGPSQGVQPAAAGALYHSFSSLFPRSSFL